jgi:hypothetical protein
MLGCLVLIQCVKISKTERETVEAGMLQIQPPSFWNVKGCKDNLEQGSRNFLTLDHFISYYVLAD